MALSAGSRLGPYELVGPLGAGGMGEVWRARDPRLDREVAIKVLPQDVVADPSRLKRFEKEARSASALNHPNIVTIYEVGASDAVAYIAMERVDGRTLRELLFGGALTVKKLLAIAAQIADGLARAHEAGIVHRDLKPENLMVTKDGLVKILDFGLAKQTAVGSGSDETSHLATETGTSPGVVLGTVGYMSPEQAAGQPVDFRSDQFAFGSILYEMATGKRAFQKGTAVDTLSAILHEEPKAVGEINPEAPAPLRWIVERCLAKDPEERFGTTRDLARDLATLRDHLTEAVGVRGAAPAVRSRRARALVMVAILAAAAGVLLGKALWKTAPPRSPTFQPLTFRRGSVGSARFSPDGNTIVYSASWNGEPGQLYSTRPESRESAVLPFPGTSVASISSSGEMALLKDDVLSRAPLAGGAARDVLEGVTSADWSPDGSQLVVVHKVNGRFRIEYPIGKVLYEVPTPGLARDIRVSPGGDRIAFVDALRSWDASAGSVAVVDLTGKKTVLSTGWGRVGTIVWSPAGDEVWFSGDERKGAARGELRAVSLAGRERVVLQLPVDSGFTDVHRNGRALLNTGPCRGSITGVVPGDKAERDLTLFDFSIVHDLSADGATMLFSEGLQQGTSENAIYIRKLGPSLSAAVRIGEGNAFRLSPDGRWVVASMDDGKKLIIIPTGPGETRTLERGSIELYLWGAGWFPDGKSVWFNGRESGGPMRAYAQDIDGGKPRPLLPEGIRGTLVSPDGKLFAAIGPSGGVRKIVFYSPEGRPIALPHDLPPGSEPSVFSADSRFLFTFGYGQVPTPVYRLDLATGKKLFWKELAPTDRSGLDGMGMVRLSADGSSYAYFSSRCLEELYLVEGLK